MDRQPSLAPPSGLFSLACLAGLRQNSGVLDAFLPNHPGFVHFPLGLLSGAFVFELIALAFRRPALHEAGKACLYLGTLAALITVGTGLWGEGLVEPRPPALDRLIDTHQTLAFLTASLAVVLSMWRVSLRRRYEGRTRVMFVAGLGVLAALVLLTGHIGGRLVYDHGAAVTVGKRSFGSKGLPAETLPAARQPAEKAPPAR